MSGTVIGLRRIRVGFPADTRYANPEHFDFFLFCEPKRRIPFDPRLVLTTPLAAQQYDIALFNARQMLRQNGLALQVIEHAYHRFTKVGL